MKFGFYISGKSGRLIKFLQQASKEVLLQIGIVISEYELQEEMLSLMEEKNIRYIVFEYRDLSGHTNKEKNLALSNLMLETLIRHKIDYCFSFGAHILAGELLERYEYRIINFHPALLPLYPGNNAIDQAVKQGNTLLVGNTAHFIDSGMDTGKVIMQSVIPLQAFLDSNDYDSVLDLQIDMLNKLIYVLGNDRLEIINGRVHIHGADYTGSAIYPYICTD